MAQKRSNGEGTLRKRPTGLWECTMMIGFQENGKRKLCNIGGAVLHFWPETRQLTKAEFYELLEHLAALPEVNEVFRQAMELHHEHEGGG